MWIDSAVANDYNAEVTAEDKVRLYGFDMHRDIPAKGILKAFYEMTDEADSKGYREKLDAFYGDAEWSFDTSDK